MIAVVAADLDWGIGYRGQLLCKLPGDMKRFRSLTMGLPVIYGRKTLETFPGGKPLHGRKDLILTHDQELKVDGAECFTEINTLLNRVSQDGMHNTAVIGGGSVYQQLLLCCTTVYVTRILRHFQADSYFPPLGYGSGYKLVKSEGPFMENGIMYRFDQYQIDM